MWRIARLFNTEIRAHYNWSFIAFFIFMSLEAHFHQLFPNRSLLVWVFAAGLAWFLFFASLIAHELSHTLVARSYGLPVSSITLFVFGAAANLEKEPEEPKVEFWVAIVGPLASMIIGLLSFGVVVSSWGEVLGEVLRAALKWVGQINLALAVFNLIPAFPMDGGRVLRSILWWWTGNLQRAHFGAALFGKICALGLIGFGLFQSYQFKDFRGFWLVLIGWFIFTAAPLRIPERGGDKNLTTQ